MAVGCANSKNATPPPARDQLVKETPAFIQDSAACKKLIYAEGIQVEGVRIYDAAIIEKYQNEYTAWITKTFEVSADGGDAAKSGEKSLPAANSPADKDTSVTIKQETVPEKFAELEKLRVKYDQCMIARGWRHL